MQRILSTYLFVSKKLTRELLVQVHGAGFAAVEIFGSRAHFDYTNKDEIRSIRQALADNHLHLNSLHAPTSRDLSVNREGGAPLSVTEVERVRRIEAMDELRRVIDVAEDLRFPRLILHMGGSRETADPRKRDAAFSTLEHLVLHARHVGVTLCIENTTGEMGQPIGHAHLADGPEAERIARCFEPVRDLVVSAHIHDNHGEKDEHLPPYDGSIDWPAALPLLRSGPAADLPLTLELKEKTGADAPSLADQFSAAAHSLDRLESLE
jgi:sugar phosphate isomerase/epimerase